MKPLVSVIIVTMNRANLVERAINSVFNQTLRDFEIYVFDNGSVDGTVDYLKKRYGETINLVALQKNIGLSAARNMGLQKANGEFVAFLDDDDSWRPEKIQKQVEKLKASQPQVALNYTWSEVHSDIGVKRVLKPTLEGAIFKHAITHQPITNSSTWLIRRSCALEIGGFDSDIWRGVDGDFLRNLARFYQVNYVPAILVDYDESHGLERITKNTRKGLALAIRGEEVKLEKYKSDLRKFPIQVAKVKLRIAKLMVLDQRQGEGYKLALSALPYVPFCRDFYVLLFRSLRQITEKILS